MRVVGPPDGNGGGIIRVSPPEGRRLPKQPDLNIIVSMSINRCIGKNGDLPYHLSTDLANFRNTTMNHVVVPGRITHESIIRRINKPLPGRETIIMTQNKNYSYPGCRTANTVGHILAVAMHRKVFVIGGEQIYKLFLPYAKKMIVTHVDTIIENGDAFFPTINKNEWMMKMISGHQSDEKNDFDFVISEYIRVPR